MQTMDGDAKKNKAVSSRAKGHIDAGAESSARRVKPRGQTRIFPVYRAPLPSIQTTRKGDLNPNTRIQAIVLSFLTKKVGK